MPTPKVIIDSGCAVNPIIVDSDDQCCTTSSSTENGKGAASSCASSIYKSKMRDGIEDMLRCPICFLPTMIPYCVGPCGHTYCSRCLTQLFHRTVVNFLEQHKEDLPCFLREIPKRIPLSYMRDVRKYLTVPSHHCPECRSVLTVTPFKVIVLADLTFHLQDVLDMDLTRTWASDMKAFF